MGIQGESVVEIFCSIRDAIEEGQLSRGEKLPTVRALADQLGVNRNTVALAYKRLAEQGLIETSGRAGSRVLRRSAVLPEQEWDYGPGVRDLSLGNPDPDLLPDLGPAIRAAAARPRQLYGGLREVPALVEAVRAQARADGLDAEHVAIVGGAVDGMDRVLSAHLGPGDTVGVEEPCFTRVLQLVRALGLQPVPMRLDDEGILPSAFEEVLQRQVRAVIVTPTAHNPTGATLTANRAEQLRVILAAYPNVLLVEDDHYRRLTTRPAFSLAAKHRVEKWAVVRSFSKCLGPDLRIGVLFGDAETVYRVRARLAVGMAWVSHLLQWVAVELIKNPATSHASQRAGTIYRRRREHVLNLLEERGIAANGVEGLHVWIPTSKDQAIARFLIARGWAVRTGDMFSMDNAEGLRVTSAVLREEEAETFAEHVAAAMRPSKRTIG